jgi:hypothetical protein
VLFFFRALHEEVEDVIADADVFRGINQCRARAGPRKTNVLLTVNLI